MAPLLIKKMVIAALALPAMTVLSWQATSSNLETSIVGIWGGRCCKCYSWLSARKRRRGIRLDDVVAQILTWLDIAIVFGPQIPLLVPLVLLAIVGIRGTVNVGRGQFGRRQVGQDESRPAVWSVVISLLAQQGLNLWLFTEMDYGDAHVGGNSGTGGTMGDFMLHACAVGAAVLTVLGMAGVWVMRRCRGHQGRNGYGRERHGDGGTGGEADDRGGSDIDDLISATELTSSNRELLDRESGTGDVVAVARAPLEELSEPLLRSCDGEEEEGP
jgi:hypothetical protein